VSYKLFLTSKNLNFELTRNKTRNMATIATFNTNGVVPTGIVSSGNENTDGLVITEPLDTDIISGRGARGRNHVGTQAYRTLVQRNQARYSICPEREKRMISKSIVDTLLSDGRRFIGQQKGSGVGWYVMSFDEAVKKTSQALREGQPKRRQNIVRSGTTGSASGTNPVDDFGTATLSSPGTSPYVPPKPLIPATIGIGSGVPSNTFSHPTPLVYQPPPTLSHPTVSSTYLQPPHYVQPPYYAQSAPNPYLQAPPSPSQLHPPLTPSNVLPSQQYQQQQQQQPTTGNMGLKSYESPDERTLSSDFTRFSISSVSVAGNEPADISDTRSREETHQDIVLPSSTVIGNRTDDTAAVDVFNKKFCPVDLLTDDKLSPQGKHSLPTPAVARRATSTTSTSTANTSDTISQKLSGRGLLLYAEQQKSLHDMSTIDGGEDISDLSLLQPLLVSSIRTCMTSAKSVIRDDMDISTNQILYEPVGTTTFANSKNNNITVMMPLEHQENLLPDFVLDDVNERKAFTRGLGFDDNDIEILTEFWAPSIISKTSPNSDRTFDKKVEAVVGKNDSGPASGSEGRSIAANHSLSDLSTEHVRVPNYFDQSAISMMSQPSTLNVVHEKRQQKQNSPKNDDPPVSAMRESFASMKRNRTTDGDGNTATTNTDEGDVFMAEIGRKRTPSGEMNISGMSDFSSFITSYSQVLLAQDFRSDNISSNLYNSFQNDVDEDSASSTGVHDNGDDDINHNNDFDDSVPTRSYERCNATRWYTSM
jgi:hypothetical protein